MQTNLVRHLLPLCLSLATVQAEVQTSDIQGFFNASAPANTDTLVSPAFSRPVAWVGTVQSATSNRLTVNGSPGWTGDQFAPGGDTYYVRVLTGALRGQFLTVASNTTTSLLVDAGGLDLTAATGGDVLEIAPYWTLGTVYPAGNAGVSFIVSTSALVHQTELYLYDPAGSGINRAPSATYYYFNGAWRKTGAPVATSFNGKVLSPDTYLLQRNKAGATTLTQIGRVHPGRLATSIEAAGATRQDNYVAVAYPVGLTLRHAALADSAAFVTSTSTLAHADELLTYDPAGTGINRAPTATYYYYNGGWRKTGSPVGTDFSDTVTLAAGSGFIVRRAAGGTTGAWTFDTNL